MNTVRKLPFDEWHRLLELDGWLGELPRKGHAVVHVTEDNLGDIIAFWWVLQVYHIEPMWIREDHRGGLIPRRLWAAVQGFLDKCSIFKAFCHTEILPVEDYLERLGMKPLPTRMYIYESGSDSGRR